jgi:phosphatidate cytidylyltransferase
MNKAITDLLANAGDKFGLVVIIVFTLLVLATAITRFLCSFLPNRQEPKTKAVLDNLVARLNTWWILVSLFALSFVLGSAATVILFAVGSFLALREFLTLTVTETGDHMAMAVAFLLVLPFQYLLIALHWYGLFAIMVPVYSFLILPIFPVLRQDTSHFLERIAKTQWGLIMTVYCVSHAPALFLLTIPNYPRQNGLLLFFLVFVTQVSDVLQYVFGKLFGRTPIARTISPSKTVEGLVWGGLGATLCGGLLWWITPFNPIQAFAFSLLIVVAGFAGGLVLSAVKRSLGAKDWGRAIAGHGGALDRLDSLSFSAPIFFHIVRFFFAV